ncbi:MAG: tetracycline regulation of excision, RteC [Pedobacter sp.]|nr:MAG: tetracycline regulation of excision, RteC [Pedobacter sp.]
MMLMEMINQWYLELQAQVATLEKEQLNILCYAKRAIVLANQQNTQLKDWLKEYSFSDLTEEIAFFKTVKPRFSSQLVYFSEMLRIETYRPLGKPKQIRKYLQKELNKLLEFTEQHRDFYRYHLTGDTHLDDKYFVRSACSEIIESHSVHPDRDTDCTTVHSTMLSTLMANELLHTYLEKELHKLDTGECKDLFARKLSGARLDWTGPKAALIELMYSLQTAGVFNDAKADIKHIAGVFESVFNVELGDFYRTYQSIRVRKKNRTSFIDSLKEMLVQRMDETDERAFLMHER